jgi:hypothetical protein
MSRLKADENPIVLKTFAFAVSTAKYCQTLQKDRNFPLSNQLFKSSTSIGKNVREAQNAESKTDKTYELEDSGYIELMQLRAGGNFNEQIVGAKIKPGS